MNNAKYRNGAFVLSLAICLCAVFATTSCSSKESKVKKAIEDYLKGQKITDVIVDIFYTNPDFPDKAYASATVVHTFADPEGKPQREFLGFILKREGNDWRVERFASYTKDEQTAKVYLGGGD